MPDRQRTPAEAQLSHWEDRFRERASHSVHGVVVVAKGQIMWMNAAAASLFGSEQQSQLVGGEWLSTVQPECHDHAIDAISAALTGAPALTRQIAVSRVDGVILTVESAVSRITWNLAPAVEITLRDTAGSLHTETSLRAFESRFRALVDATSDFTFRLNADFTHLLEFDGRVLSGADQTISEQKWLERYIHPDDHGSVKETVRSAVTNGRTVQLEHRIARFEGGWRWVVSRAIPVCDERGAVLEWLGAVTDITEQKRAQEVALAAESRNRFRAALSDTLKTYTDPAEVQAEAGRIIREHLNVDRVCYTDVSYTGAVSSGQSSSREEGAYLGGVDAAILQRCLKGEPTVVSDVLADPHLSAAQRKRWSNLGIRAQVTVPWHKEERLLGLMTVYHLSPRVWSEKEVSLMKEAVERIGAAVGRARSEALLRASEERYRGLFNAMDDAFCVVEVLFNEPDGRLDYRFVEANASFQRHTGIHEPLARTMRSIAPNHEEHWYEIYAEVARTGQPRRFEQSAAALGGKWFDAYAFRVGRPEEHKVAIIFDDITQRRAMEQLQVDLLEREHAARHAAEAAAQAKDDFLAMLSHELRTPLNPVLMLASESAVDPTITEDLRSQFACIRRNVELEARLIDDLLDVTRITRGKMVLEMQATDLHTILNEAIRTVTPDIQDKDIRFSVNVAASHTSILADPVRLQQVLWNILRNAVKFTPVGGSVSVRTFDLAPSGTVAVEVIDSGIGMTPDEIGSAFEPFVQGRHVNNRAAHQFGGLGLGLAISKKLAEMHQGSIAAASGGIGHGCTFTLELPILKDSWPAVPSPNASAPQRSESEIRRQGLRILVVEDHEPTRSSLKTLLERRAHHVRVAGTFADGKAALTQQSFDILLSDLGLPDGDGNQLAACLRELQPRAVAIALSGYGQDHDLTRSADAGFRGHLVKPIAMEKLDSAIAEALRQGTT